MEEIALLYIRSVVTKEQVDGVAVIARHYAAREGEEWISVSERLPKLFEVTEVQIKLRDGSILNEAIHQTDGDWWWQNRFLDAAEVTHWRPLPAAPNTSEAQR